MNKFRDEEIEDHLIEKHIIRILNNIVENSELGKYLSLDISLGVGLKKGLIILRFHLKKKDPFHSTNNGEIYRFIRNKYTRLLFIEIDFNQDILVSIESVKLQTVRIPEFDQTLFMDDETFELWFKLNYGV
jgi:hypothetical protein